MTMNVSHAGSRLLVAARDNPDLTISALVVGVFTSIRIFKPEWTMFPDVINHLLVPAASAYFVARSSYNIQFPALEYSIEGQDQLHQAIARGGLLIECALMGYVATVGLGQGMELAQKLGIVKSPGEITNRIYQMTSNLEILKPLMAHFAMYSDDRLADFAANVKGGQIGMVLFGASYAGNHVNSS